MTREEAIEKLEAFAPMVVDDTREALDMAIEALKTDIVRCGECKYRDPENKHCDCGLLERLGCRFPVNDDYFCSYGERSEE